MMPLITIVSPFAGTTPPTHAEVFLWVSVTLLDVIAAISRTLAC